MRLRGPGAVLVRRRGRCRDDRPARPPRRRQRPQRRLLTASSTGTSAESPQLRPTISMSADNHPASSEAEPGTVLAVPKVRVVTRWISSWRSESIETGDRDGRAPPVKETSQCTQQLVTAVLGHGHTVTPMSSRACASPLAPGIWSSASSCSRTATGGDWCCSPYRRRSSRPHTSWPGESPDPGATARTSMQRFLFCPVLRTGVGAQAALPGVKPGGRPRLAATCTSPEAQP
jgi:hypothetical protein